MHDSLPGFDFLATGVGSVPFKDIETTCREISEKLPQIPFWPQFVKRSHLEDMIIQYSEGLPLLEINEGKRSLFISGEKSAESELTNFYDHFLSGDIEYFAISKNYAPGLYSLVEILEKDQDDLTCVKGQTTGPITFAAGITDLNGKSVLYNPDLLEAMVNGLAVKALWQVRKLAQCGKKTILFLDEPFLSGFGSAFSPIERHEVIENLRKIIGYLREHSDTLIGIHCCGNTDWSMILDAGPDIVNFDSFGYIDYFLLYKDDIIRFLKEGGIIAWGVVPTADFTGEESADGLFVRLKEGLDRIYEWGIDPHFLSQRSILTPSCGMGTMTPEAATKCLALLSKLSRKCDDISSY
jgi:methionine synthase II (cobalamin-independent)